MDWVSGKSPEDKTTEERGKKPGKDPSCKISICTSTDGSRGDPEGSLTEWVWQAAVIASSSAVLLISVFCLSHGITIIFMHLYYFPIVLLTYRYRYRGFALAALLALAYIGLVYFYDFGQADVISGAWYRFFVFIGIAIIIAYLSEQLVTGKNALRESEQKFREIFNTINDAIELHEIKDNGLPGKYLEVNDVTCRMLGYSREEMLKRTPLDISTDYHNPPLGQIFEEQRTLGSSRFETEHRRKDGIVIPVEVYTRTVTISGKKVMLGVVRDITERKKAEALLRNFNEKGSVMFFAETTNSLKPH